MALSNKTIQNLAIALTPEVINYIYSDERYADFMLQMITEAVKNQLKSEDCMLVGEISCCVMDNITFKAVTV